jgi:hypothetical protein
MGCGGIDWIDWIELVASNGVLWNTYENEQNFAQSFFQHSKYYTVSLYCSTFIY